MSCQFTDSFPNSPAPAPKPNPSPVESAEVVFATYNIKYKVSDAVARKDVNRLTKFADIIALNEFGSNSRREKVLKQRAHWDHYSPTGEDARQDATPVMWRKSRFELVDKDSVRALGWVNVGNDGGIRRQLAPKYVNWVKLRDKKTGKHVVVIPVHLHPSIEASGAPHPKRDERTAGAIKHLEVVARLAERFAAEPDTLVIVAGDFNINYRLDRKVRAQGFPSDRLGAAGLACTFASKLPKLGTINKGRRLIDQIWCQKQRARASTRVLRTGYHSDHHPVVATFKH